MFVGDVLVIIKCGLSDDLIDLVFWLIKIGRVFYGDVIKYFFVIDIIVIFCRNE